MYSCILLFGYHSFCTNALHIQCLANSELESMSRQTKRFSQRPKALLCDFHRIFDWYVHGLPVIPSVPHGHGVHGDHRPPKVG